MSPARTVARFVVDGACRVLGRGRVVRAARFALNRGRLDVPNSMHNNGETALQSWVLGRCAAGTPVQVFDVGANRGDWTGALLTAAEQCGRTHVTVHAFEPSMHTYSLLRAALTGQPVKVHQCAVSDHVGEAVLTVIAPAAGTNSLNPDVAASRDAATEVVPTTTLDAFAAERDIVRIHLLKIDTEGHDLNVLRGAGGLLTEQRVDVVQFEYNHRWIYARAFLRDAFELLGAAGYHLGKLTPQGVEFYPGWDPDLETFVEGNYVACTTAAQEGLPHVRWWKSVGQQ